jgi:hypothetical protein
LTILSRIISTYSTKGTAFPRLQSFAAVKTASLIPQALEGIPTGNKFISRLPEFDAEFSKLRGEASIEGKVLRIVGVVDAVSGQVKAGLEKCVTFDLAMKYLTRFLDTPLTILFLPRLGVRTTLSCFILYTTVRDLLLCREPGRGLL